MVVHPSGSNIGAAARLGKADSPYDSAFRSSRNAESSVSTSSKAPCWTSAPLRITTVRGVGYLLEASDTHADADG